MNDPDERSPKQLMLDASWRDWAVLAKLI